MSRRRAPTAKASSPARAVQIVLLVVGGTAPAFVLGGLAFAAAPVVTIATGPFVNGQNIAVSGSGFPTRAQDPTGLQIIECSDPDGSPANLPTDPSLGCEGITVNPGQVNTDSAGRFHASYAVAMLSTGAGTSSIDCDDTHECVLWVGTDYNNAFLSGPHAFSTPFRVSAGSATAPTTTPVPTPTTAVPTSSGTTSPATSSDVAGVGSLASTGPPGLVLWLVGLGVPMVLLGLLGRRLTIARTRTPE
jgi:hypothetical protein